MGSIYHTNPPAAGITRLSELIIDVSKNWGALRIENLGAPDSGDDAEREDRVQFRTGALHAAADHEPGGGLAMAVDAVAATGSLRTLGVGAQQGAPGNHTHTIVSDARSDGHLYIGTTGSETIYRGTIADGVTVHSVSITISKTCMVIIFASCPSLPNYATDFQIQRGGVAVANQDRDGDTVGWGIFHASAYETLAAGTYQYDLVNVSGANRSVMAGVIRIEAVSL